MPPTQAVPTVDVGEAGPDDPTTGLPRDELMKGNTAPLGGAPKVVRHTPTLGSLVPPRRRGAGFEASEPIAGESLVEAVVDQDIQDTHEVDVSPTYDEALRSEARTVGKAPDREALSISDLPTRALPAATISDAPPTQIVDAVSVPDEEPEAPGSTGLALVAAGLGVLAVLGIIAVIVLAVIPAADAPDEAHDAPSTATTDPSAAGVPAAQPPVDAGEPSSAPASAAQGASPTAQANSADAGGDSANPSPTAGAASKPASEADAGTASPPTTPPAKVAASAPAPKKAAASAPAPKKAAASAPAPKKAAASAPAPKKVTPGKSSPKPKLAAALAQAELLPPDKAVDAVFVAPDAIKAPWTHRSYPPAPDKWGVVRLGGIDAVVVPTAGASAVDRTGELVETFRVLVAAHRDAGGGDVLIVAIEDTPWLVWRARTGAKGPRALEIMPLDDGDLSAMARFETPETLVRRWGQVPALLTDLLDLVALGQVPSRVRSRTWLAAADAWLESKGKKLAPADVGALNAPAWRSP